MNPKELVRVVAKIAKEKDPCLKHLQLASLLARLFKKEGYSFVVVGGSAIELLTEGAYTSGDLDICWEKTPRPPLQLCQKIMGYLSAKGGPRNWEVCGTFVDTLGMVETDARTAFRKIKGPYGIVSVAKPEDLIVEKTLVAYYPQENKEAKNCAKKLLAACFSRAIKVDWDEVDRLARLPSYDVVKKLETLKKETASENKKI